MADIVVDRLWTENSISILVVVIVTDNFYYPMRHGPDGCGKFVNIKLNNYLECGVRTRQVLFHNNVWRDGCGKFVDRKLGGYFGCGVCNGYFVCPDKQWRGMVVKNCGHKF